MAACRCRAFPGGRTAPVLRPRVTAPCNDGRRERARPPSSFGRRRTSVPGTCGAWHRGRGLRGTRLGSARDRARAHDGAAAAVSVRGLHAGWVLRDRRSGRRLLRPVHAVLRSRTHGVPPPPRARVHPGDGDFAMRASTVEYHAPARFDDLLEVFVRVERIGTTSITYDHAAYKLGDDDRRRADGDGEADARLDRPRRAQAARRCPTDPATARRSLRGVLA